MSSHSAATWSAHLRLQQAPFVQNVLLEGSALGAKRAAIDGVVGVALHVDHLGRDVLGAVPNGINNDAAANRTVGTGGAGLVRSRNLQVSEFRVGGLQVETKNGRRRTANRRQLSGNLYVKHPWFPPETAWKIMRGGLFLNWFRDSVNNVDAFCKEIGYKRKFFR